LILTNETNGSGTSFQIFLIFFEGYTVGVNLFLENLDVDIQKEEAIVEYEDEDILIKTLFTKEGYEVTEG